MSINIDKIELDNIMMIRVSSDNRHVEFISYNNKVVLKVPIDDLTIHIKFKKIDDALDN